MKLDPAETPYGVLFQTLSACVAPRPVMLVSTVSPTGTVNVAPFSMVTLLSATPALVGLCLFPRHDQPKDTLRNVEQSGEFVLNTVTADLVDPLVQASADYPPEVSEAAVLGLRLTPSDRVRPPRVADARIQLECRLAQIVRVPRAEGVLVVGEIQRIHIADAILHNGAIAHDRYSPLGHLSSGSRGYLFSTVGRLVRCEPPAAVGRCV